MQSKLLVCDSALCDILKTLSHSLSLSSGKVLFHVLRSVLHVDAGTRAATWTGVLMCSEPLVVSLSFPPSLNTVMKMEERPLTSLTSFGFVAPVVKHVARHMHKCLITVLLEILSCGGPVYCLSTLFCSIRTGVQEMQVDFDLPPPHHVGPCTEWAEKGKNVC